MKKNLGFSSFEFYFVVSVIGLVLIVGIQRYYKLAEQIQHLSLEILAQNFNAAVYSNRARWLIAQQSPERVQLSSEKKYQLDIENSVVQFSVQGWPIAVIKDHNVAKVTESTCLSLWNTFLQNPPPISYAGDKPYGSHKYHLTVTEDGLCRFELVTPTPGEFYFDYSPVTGQVKSFATPIVKNS